MGNNQSCRANGMIIPGLGWVGSGGGESNGPDAAGSTAIWCRECAVSGGKDRDDAGENGAS